MVLATHSIRQFPLHFPSTCVITFQLESIYQCVPTTEHILFAVQAHLLCYLIFRILVDDGNVEYEAPGSVYSFVLSSSLCLQ